MDTLDGRYSRMSGKGTQFGAFLDSTLDRASEGIVLTAVAYQFADEGKDVAAAAVVAAVLASVMVSYTRARAEALGIKGDVGIAPRAVRVSSSRSACSSPKVLHWGTSSCSSRRCTSSPS
jgi:CDP-diacylglycerol--glycerol-3-phosphate 3-phosphatidyltransferase